MAAPAVLTVEQIEALEPYYIGPTWQRGPVGTFIEPKYTIGWDVIFWCEHHVRCVVPATTTVPSSPT
jgi:hypothetical protein